MKNNIVITSFAWKMAERVLLQGLAVVVQVILARLLMPSDFAAVALINAVIHYLGLFVQSGLSTVVVQKKELDNKDISTLMTYSLCTATLLYISIFFLAPLLSNYYNVGDLILPIRVAALSLFLYSFRTIFFLSIVAMPIAAVIAITMAFCGMGIWALICNTLLNILLTVIIMNTMPELRIKLGFSFIRFKQLFSFSGKILLTTLISGGGDTLRTLVIGKFYSQNSLAFYDRAYYYANLVTQTVNTSIQSVLLPVFSQNQESIEGVKNMARKSVRLSAFFMIPILAAVALVARPLILILLSEKWLPCAPFLSIFCMLRIPCIITSVDKQVYYALGKSQIGLYFEIVLLILNILSLFVTITAGVMYVAIGFTVIEYLSNIILCVVSQSVYSYSLRERIADLIKPTINSIFMVAIAYSVSPLISNDWLLFGCQVVICLFSYIIFSRLANDENLSYILKLI